MLRTPAVAGRFYSSDPAELKQDVGSLLPTPPAPLRSAVACVVPHAAYRYSGAVAGAVYSHLKLPRRFLLLGPRHLPRGKARAILSEGAWQTPLGRAEIDAELASDIKAAAPQLCEDHVAHQTEHSLELQLPFLQFLVGDFRFVPVVLGPTGYAQLEALGNALADVLRSQADPVLMIATSDMNHHESDEITRRKDGLAIERILSLDPGGLFDVVRREGISMCGFGPVVSMLTAARLLGATRASLERYATSGDVDGNRAQVVGYAGLIVE